MKKGIDVCCDVHQKFHPHVEQAAVVLKLIFDKAAVNGLVYYQSALKAGSAMKFVSRAVSRSSERNHLPPRKQTIVLYLSSSRSILEYECKRP